MQTIEKNYGVSGVFQKYKYVLAVYQEGSFTRAAERLYISQPSLSVAIRNIEKKVGMPLFERCGTTVGLTEAGKLYIEAARKMQFAEDAFTKQLEDISGLQTGKLVVGGSNYLTSDVLPQLVSRFRNQHPGVEITLIEANSLHLREMLSSEEADIVIDNYESYADAYELYPLAQEQILLCVPADHPVNRSLKEYQILPETLYAKPDCVGRAAALDISAFRDEPFVLLKSGNDMQERAMQIFDGSNVEANVVFAVDQLNISYALAESGLGACFITDTFFKYRKHTADVVLYKLDHPQAKRKLHIAHKKGRYCTKAMQEFIRITRESIGTSD